MGNELSLPNPCPDIDIYRLITNKYFSDKNLFSLYTKPIGS